MGTKYYIGLIEPRSTILIDSRQLFLVQFIHTVKPKITSIFLSFSSFIYFHNFQFQVLTFAWMTISWEILTCLAVFVFIVVEEVVLIVIHMLYWNENSFMTTLGFLASLMLKFESIQVLSVHIYKEIWTNICEVSSIIYHCSSGQKKAGISKQFGI